MRKPVKIIWDVLGAELASGDNEEQALFFKGFISEMKSWGTNYQAQLQFCSIAEKLSKEDKKFLEENFPCVWEYEKEK